MGPLLFILYINDLYTAFDCCKYYFYADDTALYTFDIRLRPPRENGPW